MSERSAAVSLTGTHPRVSWPRRLIRNGVASIGLAIVLATLGLALAAPLLIPADPMAIRTSVMLQPPSRLYWLGTDQFGRDILSRLLIGARTSMVVAFGSVALALGVGTTIGLLGGFWGGRVDGVAMRIMDILFAFPAILLAIAIMAVVGPSVPNLILAIGIVYTPQFARISRAATLSIKHLEFMEAARAIGASTARVVARYLVPNVLAPIVVQVSVSLSLAILSESALSFLGLGTQPPTPSWGNMLSEGRQFMEIAPWNAIFPGMAIMVVVLGFNLLGDGLHDVLDPRLR